MFRLAAGVLLLGCAGFAAYAVWQTVHAAHSGFLAQNDFFAQWSFARFSRFSDPAAIYDADALHRFQLGLEPQLRQSFPFPYPPTYLLAVWPLAALPIGTAELLWDAATLVLFLLASAGARDRAATIAFAALAPAVTVCLMYGQNGLLLGALLAGGMRLLPCRPGLAGVLLGLATIKPQLGLLVPFALLAARQWRACAAAAGSAAALALLAAWAFGPEIWPTWIRAASGHAAWLEASVSDYRKPTVMATLSLLGADPATAQALQLAAAILVAAVVCACFRRGVTPPAIAALAAGTFLALPFAFVYDLPVTVSGLLLYARTRPTWRPVEAAIAALALLFPALTFLTTRFFYMNTVALALLFALCATRALQMQTPRLDEPGRRADPDAQAE